MEYKDITLIALGMAGVLLHSLVKISALKKSGNTFSMGQYLSTEWPSMTISAIVVFVAAFCKHEVKQLEAAGQWLGLGFVALGYMGQSILISFIGKAEKKLGIDVDGDGNVGKQ